MLSKSAYRAIRYHPIVERLQNTLRKTSGVRFEEIDLFVPAGPGDVIIDAGANVGSITSKAARTGATVHAFEPNPICFATLQRRFAAQSNVHLHNKGLMDRNCTLTLSTPIPHNGYDAVETTVAASFVAQRFDADVIKDEIECVDVAEVVRGLGRITLLKMDIEGAEIPVLHRLLDEKLADRIGIAVVETHERFSPEVAAKTNDLKKRLEANGLGHWRLDWI
ncbi:FkbM family methyltransferase [Sphingomonas sp. KRR8]|uniref:FkbM family methyltransferase n=1 Tax=Sphingomonas sp. KRR8 TaxID=2942996 RepID=UPI0020214D77|nr:FkbM family methyltransferase [Sphingomonas sp. KRR8]URD60352.1 FkbM family methyltransferase [Sphingomonas sp. KRR8]